MAHPLRRPLAMAKQRLCIVSRAKANFFGYLTAALMPAEGLEFVVDRRTPGRDSWTPWTPAGPEDRRHVAGVDALLSSRGWALLSRDAASGAWVCDPDAVVTIAPRRRSTARARRERRAFLYVACAVATLALAGAVVGLGVVRAYRIPVPFAGGILGHGAAPADDVAPPSTSAVTPEIEATPPDRGEEPRRREPAGVARRPRR